MKKLKTWMDFAKAPASHKNELISIQCLRGVACLMVLTYHVEDIARLMPSFQDLKTFWSRVGYAGPDLFFVISGFIMCYVTFNRRFEPRRWLINRIIRIYPAYVFFTALALAVWLYNPSMTMGSGPQTWETIFKSFLIFPQPGLPLVFIGWTVEHEIVFYMIVFCAAFFGGGMEALMAIMGILSGLGALRWLLKNSIPWLNFWDFHFLSLYMTEFYIGALIFHFRERLRILGQFAPFTLAISFFVLGGFMAEPGTINDETLPRVLIFGAASGFLLLGALNREHALRGENGNRALHKRPFIARIGDASYSIYLLHPFFLSLSAKILNALQAQGAFAIMGVIAAGFGALFSGMIFFAFAEKPLLSLMKLRFLPERKPNV